VAQLAWSFSLLRVTPEPLDTSFVFEDMAAFTTYLAGPTAYAGQIVAVKNATNTPDVYLIYEDRTYGGFATGGGGGAQGPQGSQGPQGPIGASLTMRGSVADLTALYALPGPHTIGDLWITTVNPARHGHVWSGTDGHTGPSTATDWDDVGEVQGPAGVQGPQGFQGAPGPQGDAGAQGAGGAQGTQGPMGLQGPPGTGIMGPQGPQGVQGIQGVQGPQGSGVQGAQGAQGAQGFQGAGGAQGAQGSQGPVGITSIGGDLAGTPDAAIVWAVRSQQWADIAPAFRQVPMWDGSRWVPTDLPTAPSPGAIDWDGGTTTWDGGATTWS
jgi:hypothetical protein